MMTALILYACMACLSLGFLAGDYWRDAAANRLIRRQREEFDGYVASVTETIEQLGEASRERVTTLKTAVDLAWREAEELERRNELLEGALRSAVKSAVLARANKVVGGIR